MATDTKTALDPGSRIPDPPVFEEDVLGWARELTEKLRNDHADSVDRVENMIMSDYRDTKRPDAKGTKRMFYDQYTGVCYMDVLDKNKNPKWVPINASQRYVKEGKGVYVKYSTSLPAAGLSSGYFSYDEEVYDEASYWSSGSEITLPETRAGEKRYQIQIHVEISALSADEEFIFGVETYPDGGTGWSDIVSPDANYVWMSDGSAKSATITFTIDGAIGDRIRVGYNSTATFTLNNMYTVVTPVKLSELSGQDEIEVISHSDLADLDSDDHLQYLLASDATNRTTFATNWTDLTDGGTTTLHTHSGDIYLDNGNAIYWRNIADTAWIESVTVGAGNAMTVGHPTDTGALYVYGGSVTLSGSTTANISAATSATLTTTDGNITLTAGGSGNVNLTASGDDVVVTADLLDINATPVLENGYYYKVEGSSGIARKVIGKDGTNRVVIGDVDVLAHDIILESTANIDIGEYGSQIRIEDSSGTYNNIIEATASDNVTIGSSGFNEITITSALDINLSPGNNYEINANKAIRVVAGGLYVDGGGIDVSGGAKQIRLSYLGSAPASLANGDIWMESDGLHIYYGGAEKVVAGV